MSDYVMVPVEPTEQMMIDAGTIDGFDAEACPEADKAHIEWWKRMLSARPATEGEAVPVGYQWLHSSAYPRSGASYWHHEEYYNGHRSTVSRPIYASPPSPSVMASDVTSSAPGASPAAASLRTEAEDVAYEQGWHDATDQMHRDRRIGAIRILSELRDLGLDGDGIVYVAKEAWRERMARLDVMLAASPLPSPAATSRSREEWQPIETLPKGTNTPSRVDLWVDGARATDCWWRDDKQVWIDGDTNTLGDPTHWRLPPDPPGSRLQPAAASRSREEAIEECAKKVAEYDYSNTGSHENMNIAYRVMKDVAASIRSLSGQPAAASEPPCGAAVITKSVISNDVAELRTVALEFDNPYLDDAIDKVCTRLTALAAENAKMKEGLLKIVRADFDPNDDDTDWLGVLLEVQHDARSLTLEVGNE